MKRPPKRILVSLIFLILIVPFFSSGASSISGPSPVPSDSRNVEAFTYHDYNSLVEDLHHLNSTYPGLCELTTAQQLFGLPTVKDGDKEYHHWLLTITNESMGSNKTEVHLNGGHHGDEPISVEVAFYFSKWMLEMYDTEEYVRFLIDTREIYIMPLVNPYGWVHGQREDEMGVDINRDYPYDVDPKNEPLRSIGAQAVHLLTAGHRFVTSISWHSGTESITYSWGCPSHVSQDNESPDESAFSAVASVMANFGGPEGDEYRTGHNNEILSSVHGPWDDYSYAASWDEEVAYEDFKSEGAASLSFTVEISNVKKPVEKSLGSSQDIMHRDVDGGGYLPRNLRIALAVVDLARPYIKIGNGSIPERITGNESFNISWLVGGCTSVSETGVVLVSDGAQIDWFEPREGVGIWEMGADHSRAPWEREMFETEIYVPDTPGNYTLSIYAVVDGGLLEQDDPDPRVEPQSFFVKMRTDGEWSSSCPNGTIVGQEIWTRDVVSFTLDVDGDLDGDMGDGSQSGPQNGASEEDVGKDLGTGDYLVVAFPFIIILGLVAVWFVQKRSTKKE